jgi:hypothetical protein
MTSVLEGDPTEWIPGLLIAAEHMLETLIPQAWTVLAQRGLDPKVHEDKITKKFVVELCRVKRRIYPHAGFIIDSQRQVNSDRGDDGRVDIAILYGGDEELYLAYECKWLEKSNANSLAIYYRGSKGIGRFISRKYASAMPVGCMIGYVASGDLNEATKRIHRSMAKKGMPQPSPSRRIPPLQTFTTDHVRDDSTPITITHILLPLSV